MLWEGEIVNDRKEGVGMRRSIINWNAKEDNMIMTDWNFMRDQCQQSQVVQINRGHQDRGGQL